MRIDDGSKGIVFSILKAGLLLSVFLLFLYCNLQTRLIADDYLYLYDFSSVRSSGLPDANAPVLTARIEHVSQIFRSMKSHYIIHNGRIVMHFFVQFFLLFPKAVFDVVNSAFFVAQLLLIGSCSSKMQRSNNKRSRFIVLLYSFCAVWLFQPAFGQVNLWMDGAVNYLWTSVFSLIYIYFWIAYYKNGSFTDSGKMFPLVCLSGFIAGCAHEVTGSTMIFFALAITLYTRIKKKYDIKQSVISLLSVFAGFITLLIAPSTWQNKLIEGSAKDVFGWCINNFKGIIHISSTLKVVFVITLILLALSATCHMKEDILNLVCILFMTGIVSALTLVPAAYLTQRCLYLSCILFILCDAIMIEEFMNRPESKGAVICCLVALVLAVSIPYYIFTGVSSIRETGRIMKNNESLMREGAMSDDSIVYISDISQDNLSRYSPAYKMEYLSHDSETVLPNYYMSKYYGIEKVGYNGTTVSIDR